MGFYARLIVQDTDERSLQAVERLGYVMKSPTELWLRFGGHGDGFIEGIPVSGCDQRGYDWLVAFHPDGAAMEFDNDTTNTVIEEPDPLAALTQAIGSGFIVRFTYGGELTEAEVAEFYERAYRKPNDNTPITG